MKRFTMFAALVVLASTFAWSEDGAALYKAKCAMCHGAAGEGKMGPALKGVSLSQADIENFLTKGAAGKKAPHSKPFAGVTGDQATAVAGYVKSLK